MMNLLNIVKTNNKSAIFKTMFCAAANFTFNRFLLMIRVGSFKVQNISFQHMNARLTPFLSQDRSDCTLIEARGTLW